jgi:uncharacterized phiE125 gp8 family phage protein
MYDLDDITSGTPTEPVTLAELKRYLRIPTANTNDDTDLTALLTTARRKFEQVAWRSVVAHTFRLTIDDNEEEIELPFPPIDSVSAVYYWTGSEWSELDSSDDYYLHGSYKKILEIPYMTGYKIKVEFTTLADSLPEYENLMMEWIAAVYDNRPDSDEVQEKVVKRMAKLRAQSCR